MKMLLSRLLVGLWISVTSLTSSAQQVSPLSKKAAEIKRKADALGPSAAISVIPIHGAEEYGKFLFSGSEELAFYDVDRKAKVTLKYTEIRKIKDGYGGYNSAVGRHTDRTKAHIVIVVFLALLGGLIGAAASARN